MRSLISKTDWKEMIFAAAAFALSAAFSAGNQYFVSGSILIVSGIVLFILFFRKYRSILNPSGILSLSWVCASGLSALKLSALQKPWAVKTWLSIVLFYEVFLLFSGVMMKNGKTEELSAKAEEVLCKTVFPEKWIPRTILVFTILSYTAFLIEACILGYVPLFTENTPHAYSYFHLSGVHYFTVLCVLVPPLSLIHILTCRPKRKDIGFLLPVICSVFSLILPVLLVSRFQLVFSCLLSVSSYVILKGDSLFVNWDRRKSLAVCISFFSLLLLYIFLTVERAHSVSYLNGIFEMKGNYPIWFTQPYMYIANNFDNLNALVCGLEEHTFGLRMLFPVFALTGLKFVFPELVSFPLYVTKEELTTVTVIYDAYYDFGLAGVLIFGAVLGILMGLTWKIIKKSAEPFVLLIASMLFGYLLLAFFTTWYSNPTTWFYFGVCVLADLILRMILKKRRVIRVS